MTVGIANRLISARRSGLVAPVAAAGGGPPILRPDGTITNTAVLTGAATAHDALDEVVTQPTVPSGTSRATYSSSQSTEVSVGTTVLSGTVTTVTAWAYVVVNDPLGTMNVHVVNGSTILASAGASQSGGWRSAVYSGSLTQAEVDDLRVRINASAGVGGDSYYVTAAYIELVTV